MRRRYASGFRRTRRFLRRCPAPPAVGAVGGLIFRASRNFAENDGAHMAAGVAYYSVFSLFPLALATVATVEFIITSRDLQSEVIAFLDRQLPGGSDLSFIGENLEALAAVRSAFGIIALVGLLLAGRVVFGGIRKVVNRAWRVGEPPHFLLDQLVQVGAAAGAVSLFIVTAVGGAIGRAVAVTTDLLPAQVPWGLVFEALPFFLTTTLYVMVYRLVPAVHVRWRDAVPAGIVAGLALEVTKLAFSYYLANVARLDLVYGSITTIVVLMIFFYVVSLILVWCAEFSSEIRRTDDAGLLNLRKGFRPEPGGLFPDPVTMVPPAGLGPVRAAAAGHRRAG